MAPSTDFKSYPPSLTVLGALGIANLVEDGSHEEEEMRQVEAQAEAEARRGNPGTRRTVDARLGRLLEDLGLLRHGPRNLREHITKRLAAQFATARRFLVVGPTHEPYLSVLDLKAGHVPVGK